LPKLLPLGITDSQLIVAFFVKFAPALCHNMADWVDCCLLFENFSPAALLFSLCNIAVAVSLCYMLLTNGDAIVIAISVNIIPYS